MRMPVTDDRSLHRAGWLLGIALGGFFDGILLHQVLQWHHLLSAVDDPRVQSLQTQVMADGVFHLAMYGVAAIGLWQLLRSGGLTQGAGPFIARLLRGFGAWHVADIVLNHWVLGLHRTRMGVETPLAWDLAWFVAFGLLPLALGGWWRARARAGGRHADAVVGTLAVAVIAAGLWAAWPVRDAQASVVIAPDAQTALAWLHGTDARVIAPLDRSGQAWAIRAEAGEGWRWPLRRDEGVWLLQGNAWVAGCLAYLR